MNKYLQKIKESVALKHSYKPPIIEIPSPPPIIYTAHPERSPFSMRAPLRNASISPLLVYPVSMLKFVGTMTENDYNFAYVIAPDNKLYQVKIGDKIGDNGVVSRVYPDHMDVLEKSNESGAQRVVTLQLKDENK